MGYRIFFSNLGYARGIDGSLPQHIKHWTNHIYPGADIQKEVLEQAKALIVEKGPDLCCFVEIEEGTFATSYVNQIEELTDDDYCCFDLSSKYGKNSIHQKLPFHGGKGNAFLSKAPMPFDKRYFSFGSKKLIHELTLPNGVKLLFTHFSLRYPTRQKQFHEIRQMIEEMDEEVILLADFNILKGFEELAPLLKDGQLELLNRKDEYTFAFHNTQKVLDLCICTSSLVSRMDIAVIPQPYSDHAALLVDISEI